MKSKNTMCLWCDGTTLEAATWYAVTFSYSALGAVLRAPTDCLAGQQGDVLTVEFTLMGIPCLGMNGGQESACGRCKDRWGLPWQITPRALVAAITDPDPAAAQRAFVAMMDMGKIDIAAIEAARRG